MVASTPHKPKLPFRRDVGSRSRMHPYAGVVRAVPEGVPAVLHPVIVHTPCGSRVDAQQKNQKTISRR